MTRWWRRLRRWWGQSRIRLPSPGPRAADLRAGDWVQVAGEPWRVRARSSGAPGEPVVFELTGIGSGDRHARLTACDGTGLTETEWALEWSGDRFVVAPAAMVVFPAGAGR